MGMTVELNYTPKERLAMVVEIMAEGILHFLEKVGILEICLNYDIKIFAQVKIVDANQSVHQILSFNGPLNYEKYT